MLSVINAVMLMLASGVHIPLAQALVAKEHRTDFNSTFRLKDSQAQAAQLTTSDVNSINIISRFDKTQLANGGSYADDFYTLPPVSRPPEPGTLLKVQSYTDPNAFALPPNTALSRILYTSKNVNGTVIPASAFILWPFQPRVFAQLKDQKAKAPVVLWTHGTSGFFAPSAPSMMRSLWYGDAAVFPLALDGYAVVAPDYAGLGIEKSWDGSDVPHQYLCATASSYDALYALRAARAAFTDRLMDKFVIMGHSQGGGVAWRAGEVLTSEAKTFKDLTSGHLGTIAGSPTTEIFSGIPQFIVLTVALALKGIFPSFEQSDWLTDMGIARAKLLKEIKGSATALMQLVLNTDAKLIKDDALDTWYAKAYINLSTAGGRLINKPTMIIQGTKDPFVFYNATANTFNNTCKKYPQNDMELLVVDGGQHVSSLYATRQFWLQWIKDRFEGKTVKKGCYSVETKSWLPYEDYLQAGNSLIAWAGLPEFSYERLLGP